MEGYYWGLHEIRASEAVDWANQGWLPAQVERLYDYLLTIGPKGARGTRERALEWLHTGLPAHRVLLYASAACTPPEGIAFEARRASGEDIDTGLRTLAALLNFPWADSR